MREAQAKGGGRRAARSATRAAGVLRTTRAAGVLAPPRGSRSPPEAIVCDKRVDIETTNIMSRVAARTYSPSSLAFSARS